MTRSPLPEFWTTFSPQTQHQLVGLWTLLLHRHLQAQRRPHPGGAHEPRDPHSAAPSGPTGNCLCASVDDQATGTALGEHPTPVPVD